MGQLSEVGRKSRVRVVVYQKQRPKTISGWSIQLGAFVWLLKIIFYVIFTCSFLVHPPLGTVPTAWQREATPDAQIIHTDTTKGSTS